MTPAPCGGATRGLPGPASLAERAGVAAGIGFSSRPVPTGLVPVLSSSRWRRGGGWVGAYFGSLITF